MLYLWYPPSNAFYYGNSFVDTPRNRDSDYGNMV